MFYCHKNKMFKAIKIKLYPSKSQEDYINNLLGSCRFVYNKCLNKKIEAYNNDKINLGLKELGNYYHQNLTKQEEFSWLKNHNTKVHTQSIFNLLDAYKRFFINGSGFPKYKSKKDNKQSCCFPLLAISKKNNYLSNHLTLTKQLKNIKFKTSDRYKNYLDKNKDGIRSATLVKTKANIYYLSILVDGDIDKKLSKPINDVIGIDLGIKDFIVTSDNQRFKNIKSIRNNEKKLIKLNRQLSKKQFNSKNRNKAKIKLARFHEKISNIKENYLHQITNKLLNENQVIVMEDLNVNGMLKNHNLAKSISELSLFEFKRKLKYKSEWYRRDIIEIDQWYPSSKLCNNCGSKNNNLKLSDRTWKCCKCGTVHDRDHNAAKNIRNEGLRILELNKNFDLKTNKEIKIGQRLPELTLADYPLMDEHQETDLRSYDRMKQEINLKNIN